MNCIQDSDCENENCGPLGACVSCDDDVQDGDESDVDCGGDFCDGCEDGWRCSIRAIVFLVDVNTVSVAL